jgi:hypothetical protein
MAATLGGGVSVDTSDIEKYASAIGGNQTEDRLNNHQIRLPGDRGLCLFHMKEEGHEKVRWYRFDPP